MSVAMPLYQPRPFSLAMAFCTMERGGLSHHWLTDTRTAQAPDRPHPNGTANPSAEHRHDTTAAEPAHGEPPSWRRKGPSMPCAPMNRRRHVVVSSVRTLASMEAVDFTY